MRSVRFQLARMVVISVLPVAAVSALLIYLSYERHYSESERSAIQAAHAICAAIDGELDRIETAARALAAASGLERGDVAGFYARAAQGVAGEFGRTVVLSDAKAREVLPPRAGVEPLPHDLQREQVSKVFQTGRPVVSDLFTARVGGRPRVNVDVPVLRDGRVIYDLSIQMLPYRFETLLASHQLPPGWVASVYDSKGVIVARNDAPELYVGLPALPALRSRMQQAPEGIVQTSGRSGRPIMLAFWRSDRSGWTVSVGAPEALLFADARRTLYWTSLGTLAMLVIGLCMAWLVGNAISLSIRALVAPAFALGTGEPVSVAPLAVKEAEEVAAALREADALVRRRTKERDDASVLALRDGVTGLANRRCFDEALQREWRRCRRARRPLALILIDIDHFKAFNDHYGHQAGDGCLQFVAKSLASCVGRAADLVARYGGEEFAVLMPEQTAEGAGAVAQSMADALRAAAIPHPASPTAPYVTVSMGLDVLVPDRASRPEALVRGADARLYAAKAGGRNRVCHDTPREAAG